MAYILRQLDAQLSVHPTWGNRRGSRRAYLNLAIVFLASGLWHGAAWGFVVWGAYHGFFLIIERMFLLRWLAKAGKAACVYTFLVVLSGWVFFRLVYLGPSLAYLKAMFTWHTGVSAWRPENDLYFTLLLAAFFSFFTLSAAGQRVQEKIFVASYSISRHYMMFAFTILACAISAGRITTASFNPFIYFRF